MSLKILLTKIQVINKKVYLLFPTLSMCPIFTQNKFLNFKKFTLILLTSLT